MVKSISSYQPVSSLLNFMTKPEENEVLPGVASRSELSRLSEFVAVMLELWHDYALSRRVWSEISPRYSSTFDR